MKITLTVENLKEIFKACKNFVSKDNAKPILHAIQLKCQFSVCRATAMDGYKLMTVNVPYDGDEGILYIPIIKIPKGTYVTIYDEGNEIVFDFITEKQTVRKFEGDFPTAIDTLFPAEEPQLTIGFNPKLLRDALDGFPTGEAVKMEFISEFKGCIINGIDRKSLVLPVNLRNKNLKG